MKKILIVTLTILVFVSISVSVVFGYFTYVNMTNLKNKLSMDSFFESITQNDDKTIYEIKTANQLIAFAYLQNNGSFNENDYFTVTEDIDLEGREIEPIGSTTYPFLGTFNGNAHVISNVVINAHHRGNGFFGVTAGKKENNSDSEHSLSIISKFILSNITIKYTYNDEDYNHSLYQDDFPYIGFVAGILNGKASSIGVNGGKITLNGIAISKSSTVGKINGELSSTVAGDETTDSLKGNTGIVNANEITLSQIQANKHNHIDGVFYVHSGSSGNVAINTLNQAKYNFYYLFGDGSTTLTNDNSMKCYLNATGNTDSYNAYRNQDGYFTFPDKLNPNYEDTLFKVVDMAGNNVVSFNKSLYLSQAVDKGFYVTVETHANNAKIVVIFLKDNKAPILTLYKETTGNQDFDASDQFVISKTAPDDTNLYAVSFYLQDKGRYYIGPDQKMNLIYLAVEGAGSVDTGIVSPDDTMDVSAIDFIYSGIQLNEDGTFSNGFISSKVRVELSDQDIDRGDVVETRSLYTKTIIYNRKDENEFYINIDLLQVYVYIHIYGIGSVYVNGELEPGIV